MAMYTDAADSPLLQVALHDIELACKCIQMKDNTTHHEGVLLSLRQSHRPYRKCHFILENSELANARFEAARALGDAAIREWNSLDADDRRRLVRVGLNFIMRHAKFPVDIHVDIDLVKVVAVTAQLLKRGWLEFTDADKGKFFAKVEEAVAGTYGLNKQFVGICFLKSLVSEFSPTTSTALGLPREFHEQCRISLEQVYLKKFYRWLRHASFNLSRYEDPEIEVCSAALCLMHEILNWDFGTNKAGDNSKRGIDVFCDGTQEGNSLRRSECILVQPGLDWQDDLISSDDVGKILNFYAELRRNLACKGYSTNDTVAVSARRLVVQFCSLTGAIFPSDSGHLKHLEKLLEGILDWIETPYAVSEAIKQGKSELLDGCRALTSMATVTSPLIFDNLLRSLGRPYGTLSLLTTMMSEVLRDFMTCYRAEGTCRWVARDILLDTWAVLLMQLDGSGHSHSLPDDGITAVNLFALIVDCELRVAVSKSAFNDGGKYNNFQDFLAATDKRLSSYALIGRAASEFAIPMLTTLFSDHTDGLAEDHGKIYCLLLITGYVLADDGQGETPLVPKEIERHCDAVINLFRSIMNFAGKSLGTGIRIFFSARVMEALVWFFARWSLTYLMQPEESGEQRSSYKNSNKLLSAYGDNDAGKNVLNTIIQICSNALCFYPADKDLQALTCYQLLGGLVKRKSIISHLVTLDSWRDLSHRFSNEGVMLSLNAAHQRSLAQTLATVSASGVETSDRSNEFIRGLTHSTTTYLVQLKNRNDFQTIARQPDTILLVICLLERLRGVAKASEPSLQHAIFQMGFSLLELVAIFLRTYEYEPVVVCLLLKFVNAWVKGRVIYLNPEENATFPQFCMSLLQLYSDPNKISVSLSNSLHTEADEEKYKYLRELLKLLSNLCSKDLVDFASKTIVDPVEAYRTNISWVVCMGLHIIIPLITPELLKYPKLCHCYFSLLSHMMEVCPEIIKQLKVESLRHILGTLDVGLHHQDVKVVDFCLRAVKVLASYHHKDKFAGKVGLGSHATSYYDINRIFHGSVLSQLLCSLLKQLLFEDYSTDLVTSAADALLPLILCEQIAYQNLAKEVIEKLIDPVLKQRLTDAFRFLNTSDNNYSRLELTNYQTFRKNLHSFLVEVRRFLRTL